MMMSSFPPLANYLPMGKKTRGMEIDKVLLDVIYEHTIHRER